jgi:class 3 adenylate cyclase/TolB-like protein/tetratricopeptide (TPR) repeat protein
MAFLRTSRSPSEWLPVTQRRLAAVLVADMVGYSRLMEAHEEYTHRWMMHLRAEILKPGVEGHDGRMVKNTGDGFVAMFDSASDATRCALALQQALTLATAEQPVEQRISFRMGVNVADIIIEEGDIYGDGVNVAARLQEYAEPGGIVVSGAVAEQMGSYPGVRTIDLGDLQLKNLARSVRVFALRPNAAPPRLVGDIGSGAEPRPSIAVLSFRMHPIGPEERYFVDGIADEIIHGLATLKELFVISRGSTLGYGGANLDVRAVGRELGVRYVLYGGVRRSGGMLRIVTELSDTETGAIVRADQYEGQPGDLFELQRRIAVHVVQTIAPHVQERELRRARRKHPQNLTAYDFVLQALDVLYRMDYESFSRARGLLQQAIAHDPDFAPAYAYIAYWYVFRVGEMGSTNPGADAEAAAHYAAAALERDGEDALALAISGHVRAYLMKEFSEAIPLLDRAIACGPSSAMAWTMSSATRGYMGDGETAVRHGEQGLRLSPLDARLFWHEGLLGQAHYVEGNYEKALEWVTSALSRNRSIRYNYRTLIATLVALGRGEEATEVAQTFLRLQPDFRLGPYSQNCPFVPKILAPWLARLRAANLPE